MKKYILTLLWISPYLLNAQDLNPYNNIIPPNPDAASLAKYVDFPVDLSKGVPQISIPLWNIQCGDINVPISLSYHAGGIPVAETPSYVGLGWTLNAGGAITRTIRGLADDGMFKYPDNEGPQETTGLLKDYPQYAVYPDYPNSSTDLHNPSKYKLAAVGKADLEPDMFYYSFCSLSGKFVFDFNGDPHLIPRKNFKIEKTHNSGIPDSRIIGWKITTDDGVKYYFDELEITEQDTKTEAWSPNGANLRSLNRYFSHTTSEHHSAWFLTRIEMPNSSKTVVFEYDNIVTENTYPVSETYKDFNGATGGEGLYSNSDIYEETYTESVITGVRLRRIIAPDQTVEFIPGVYRHDLKGDRVLDKMVIRNRANKIIKQFKLSYDYFSGSGMTTVGTTANANTVANTSLRLSLKKIQTLDKNGSGLPPYTFEYENSVWLPDRVTSKAQDHWGYYNGADGNTSLIPYLGAIRGASEVDMKAGSLVKINYPTGGYTQFNYEANTTIFISASVTIGGLRIKEKIDYDPVSNRSLFKQYDYHSSGYAGNQPNYSYETSQENTRYLTHTSTAFSAFNNGGGGPISYEVVSVIEGNDEIGINGKTENHYTLIKSDSYYPTYYDCQIGNDCENNKITGGFSLRAPNMFPFAPGISGSWGTGFLELQRIFKFENNAFTKVKKIENIYEDEYWGLPHSFNPNTDVMAAKVGVISSGSNALGLDEFGTSKAAVQFYFIPSRNINLIKTIETDYDDNENPIISKVTDIEYEDFSPHIYRSKITTTNSNGDNLKTTYKYPGDYSNYNFLKALRDKHMLDYVIEEKKIRNGKVVSAIHNRYTSGANPRLSSIYNIEIDQSIPESSFYGLDHHGNLLPYGRYKEHILFDRYDVDGNLLQYHKKNDIDISYIWGYNDTYPVAKVENASYEEIETALSGCRIGMGQEPCLYALKRGEYLVGYDVNKIGIYKPLDGDDISLLLESLNNNLPKALMTTYTYEPVIGMISKTSPDGTTTYFEYDDFSRLKLIKDQEGNILKMYEYNYKN